MVFILVWVIVGGTATFWGPITGVIVLTVVNEVVLRRLGADELRPFFYGLILVLTMLYLPGGLEGLPAKLRLRFGRTRGADAQPAE